MAFSRSFQCQHCGVAVSLDAPGTTHRNHCPACLWSRHCGRLRLNRTAGDDNLLLLMRLAALPLSMPPIPYQGPAPWRFSANGASP